MNSGYCAGPFKEFSEDELYERYLKMNEDKPLQENEMQTTATTKQPRNSSKKN